MVPTGGRDPLIGCLGDDDWATQALLSLLLYPIDLSLALGFLGASRDHLFVVAIGAAVAVLELLAASTRAEFIPAWLSSAHIRPMRVESRSVWGLGMANSKAASQPC